MCHLSQKHSSPSKAQAKLAQKEAKTTPAEKISDHHLSKLKAEFTNRADWVKFKNSKLLAKEVVGTVKYG